MSNKITIDYQFGGVAPNGRECRADCELKVKPAANSLTAVLPITIGTQPNGGEIILIFMQNLEKSYNP